MSYKSGAVQRYIMGVEVSEPVVVMEEGGGEGGEEEGVEWVCITVVGQAFLLHQIRKMVAVAVKVCGHLFIYLFIIYLLLILFISLFNLFIFCLFIYLFICFILFMFIYLFIYLFYLFYLIHLFIYLFIHVLPPCWKGCKLAFLLECVF